MVPVGMRQRLWLGAGVAAVAMVAAASAFGGSGGVVTTTSGSGEFGGHAMGPAASGRCSKAEATAVVKRLHLGSADFLPNPVYKVICGAFMGPGSQTMVALLASGGASAPFGGWAVFRSVGGKWQLVMERNGGGRITAAGSDIRETVSVMREGDSHCCPSGGTKARIWHWSGSRFVASPWKQVTKGEPEPRAFDSPSLNINCFMADSGGVSKVDCQSRIPPQRVTLDARGRVTICRQRGSENICNLGDRGEGPIHPLAYGRQITVGRFRCLSLESGVRCTVIQSGKGFLISRGGVSRVGP